MHVFKDFHVPIYQLSMSFLKLGLGGLGTRMKFVENVDFLMKLRTL